MQNRDKTMGIFANLVAAVDWYDNSLQQILASKGLKVVNRTQAMLLIHIVSGITKPSDIAREMRTTRQNIHAMARELIRDEVIVQVPDTEDGRSSRYQLSPLAASQRERTLEILSYLNKKLSDRIGKDTVNGLARALKADWGDLLTEMP